MLGTEVEFSTCVSQAFEMAYSGLFSVSARRWLSTATSRVVIPNLERISFSCSDGFGGSMLTPSVPQMGGKQGRGKARGAVRKPPQVQDSVKAGCFARARRGSSL